MATDKKVAKKVSVSKRAKKVAAPRSERKAVEKQGAVKRNVGSSRATQVGSTGSRFVGSTNNRVFN